MPGWQRVLVFTAGGNQTWKPVDTSLDTGAERYGNGWVTVK